MKKALTVFGWPLLVLPILLMLGGFALNETAIFANGGVMPVYSKAYEEDENYKELRMEFDVSKGKFPGEPDFLHESPTAKTRFHYLCDIFPSDGGIESIGDVVIDLGSSTQTPLLVIWFLAAIACWQRKLNFHL